MSFAKDNNWEKMNNNKTNTNPVISHAYKCNRCGGERLESMEMETRSGSFTTFIRCLDCENCWKIQSELININYEKYNIYLQ